MWAGIVAAGTDWGSRSSAPARTESSSAASATVRVSGPCTENPVQPFAAGQAGTRPIVGFSPTTPQQLAGILIDPARSVPSASGPRPAATAAAAPPLDPPAI